MLWAETLCLTYFLIIPLLGRHTLNRFADGYVRRIEHISLLIGDPNYNKNPLRQDLWRAGHAHAGIWIILALVALRYGDEARLSDAMKWVVRGSLPIASILVSAGFFLPVLPPDATAPNTLIYLVYVGAALSAGRRCVRSRCRSRQTSQVYMRRSMHRLAQAGRETRSLRHRAFPAKRLLRKHKEFANALRMEPAALDHDDLRGMREVAASLIKEALKGNITAVKEIADRIDGRAIQQHQFDMEERIKLIAVAPPEGCEQRGLA